jgi:hypothetical protein
MAVGVIHLIVESGDRRFGRSAVVLTVSPEEERRCRFSRGVKIGSVTYDGTADTVTLKLARPHEGRVQVTVRAGIVAADGMSISSEFTAVVA